jgi:hypothetical protein
MSEAIAMLVVLLWFAGVTWQRSSCIDSHGCPMLSDAYGAPLTFSGQSSDSSIMGLASMVYRSGRTRAQQSSGSFGGGVGTVGMQQSCAEVCMY